MQHIAKSKRQLGHQSGTWSSDEETVHAINPFDTWTTACGSRIGSKGDGWFTTDEPITCRRNACQAERRAEVPARNPDCGGDRSCRTHQEGKFGADPSRECRRYIRRY